jgi:hypothetical protein
MTAVATSPVHATYAGAAVYACACLSSVIQAQLGNPRNQPIARERHNLSTIRMLALTAVNTPSHSAKVLFC